MLFLLGRGRVEKQLYIMKDDVLNQNTKIINTSTSFDSDKKESIIQKNFSIVDIIYSEHLVLADRFSRKRPAPGQNFIGNLLYSRNLYRYSGHLLKWPVFLLNT